MAIVVSVSARPTSDVSSTGNWTGTVGLRYASANDFPDTVPNTVLTHGTSAGNIMFGFTPFNVPANATISAVEVLYYDVRQAAGVNNFSARIKVGSSTPFNATTHAVDLVVTLRTDQWLTNPETTLAWTVAQVNGTAASGQLTHFGFRSTDANPKLDLTSAILKVTYTMPDIPCRGYLIF